jgi:hypothetical protein
MMAGLAINVIRNHFLGPPVDYSQTGFRCAQVACQLSGETFIVGRIRTNRNGVGEYPAVATGCFPGT